LAFAEDVAALGSCSNAAIYALLPDGLLLERGLPQVAIWLPREPRPTSVP